VAELAGTDLPSIRAALAQGETTAIAKPAVPRRRWLASYVCLVLALLVPGLGLRLQTVFGLEASAPQFLGPLQSELGRITFGSGLRFWLGVAGTGMMAALLLYAARKRMSAARRLGSVGGWFHAHILLGLLGPLLILYHCNFGLGALNANVALLSMLVIMASGFLGYYVYLHINTHFYTEKRQARAILDGLVAELRQLGSGLPAERRLIAELEAFETRMLTPRQGLCARLAALVSVRGQTRKICQDAQWLVAALAHEQNWQHAAQLDAWQEVGRDLSRYFAAVRVAARRSLYEQLFALWRPMHVPLFAVMIIATIAHVIAVWDLDGEPATVAGQITANAAPGAVANVMASPNSTSASA